MNDMKSGQKERLKLSVLDFGLGEEKRNSMLRLQDLLQYARRADELGFNRFWLAEHHFHNPLLAWSDPSILISILAMHTQNIRIGTGGILLKLHNPYDIASSFKLNNNIFNNRIDLGVVNGYSYNSFVEGISGAKYACFEKKCKELLYLLREEDELFEKREVVIPPYKGDIPEVWCMSTSMSGLDRSLTYGMHFVRSIFHSGSDQGAHKDLLEKFKENYRERHKQKVKVMLALSGTCQSTQKKAKDIASHLQIDPKLHIVGDRYFVSEKIQERVDRFGISEILWKDLGKSLSDKLNSLENIHDIVNGCIYEGGAYVAS